jgi:hypothetical protein
MIGMHALRGLWLGVLFEVYDVATASAGKCSANMVHVAQRIGPRMSSGPPIDACRSWWFGCFGRVPADRWRMNGGRCGTWLRDASGSQHCPPHWFLKQGEMVAAPFRWRVGVVPPQVLAMQASYRFQGALELLPHAPAALTP